MLNQQIDHFDVIRFNGQMQRRQIHGVVVERRSAGAWCFPPGFSIHIGARCNQQIRDFQMPLLGGIMQRGLFVVIQSVIGADRIALAVLAVVCSVVSAFVYMRVAVLMYMNDPHEPTPPRLPVAVWAALAVAALVTLIGGIFPDGVVRWAVSP